MDLVKAKEFIQRQEWIFAKSYAETFPHEYMLKTKENEQEFYEFVKFIRKTGKIKRFYRKEYIYCEIGDTEYWDMGRPILSIRLINRAVIDDSKSYRAGNIPEDAEYILKKKLKERDDWCLELNEMPQRNEIQEKEFQMLMDYKNNKQDESGKVFTLFGLHSK